MKSLFGKQSYSRAGAALAGLLTVVLLAGCATGPAPQAASASGLSAGHMHLSVKMSSSVFLQPVAPAQRVVYVEGHNTSSAQGLSFGSDVRQALMSHGYQVTDDPTQAQFMLLYNVLYVGKEQANYTEAGALAGGFGSAVTAALADGNGSTVAAYGLAGALVGGVVGHFLQQNQYLMVVDIQLEQRQAGVYTTSETSAQQGTSGEETTSTSGVKNWMIYRDRIVAQAQGLNLAFDYATPALSNEVAGEISGLF